ncbi:MAG: hypothetical protein M1837_006623 [Sclerophora amabilis]|nr:MAG: hypothetical protein M1837_006623 [Sclerophora amabilis]
MHFLGSLFLHEILHFHNVRNLAWRTTLLQGKVIDDQEDEYLCIYKAYGPYEAIKLWERDAGLAIQYNESYVWYALSVSHYLLA